MEQRREQRTWHREGIISPRQEEELVVAGHWHAFASSVGRRQVVVEDRLDRSSDDSRQLLELCLAHAAVKVHARVDARRGEVEDVGVDANAAESSGHPLVHGDVHRVEEGAVEMLEEVHEVEGRVRRELVADAERDPIPLLVGHLDPDDTLSRSVDEHHLPDERSHFGLKWGRGVEGDSQ